MSFKVGDIVLIKLDRASIQQKHKLFNKVAKISDIVGGGDYNIILENMQYGWCARELELAFLYPGQICSICKSSCPHKPPNQNNNTYVCLTCSIMKEL